MTITADAVPLDQTELPFLDNQDPAYVQDPFPVIRELRESDPRGGRLFRSPRGIEVTTYDTGRTILKDTENFLSSDASHWEKHGAGPLLLEYLREGKMTTMHGERHLSHRRMLTPPLSAGAVDQQREMYNEASNRMIDAFHARGEADLVADFTNGYPVDVLCAAIGVPVEDVPIFLEVTHDMARMQSLPIEPHLPAIEHAVETLSDYVRGLLERRRGDHRGDYIDDLIAYEDAGRMTHIEIVFSLVTLLQGSHFTTRNQLVNTVRAVLENDLWDDIAADPSIIPGVVEEGMRYYPVIHAIARHAGPDGVVLDGVELPSGTVIRYNPIAAGRDPERFDEPDRFDPSRDGKGRMPFGFGIHKCLGQHMARVDMEIAIGVLTQRLRNPKLVTPVEAEVVGAFWGPRELRLTFDV